MAKITITNREKDINELALSEGTVTIGRNKDNDIQIDDIAVSAYHAKLVSFFKPTYIQDLRSTNGTYVNGKRIMEHTLSHGDIITIGKHKIFFDKESTIDVPLEPETTLQLSKKDISLIIKTENLPD